MSSRLLTLLLMLAFPAWAGPGANAPRPTQAAAPVEGIAWQNLAPATRKSLAPLERDWPQMAPDQRGKWIELAQRLPSMSPEQQQRIQSRMADWARLSPAERGEARLRFLQAQRTLTEDRERRWDDYQALPTDQKRQFEARAVPPSAPPSSPRLRPGDPRQVDRGSDAPTAKSNLVTNPNFGVQPKAIAPMTLKAGPGASTTLVTKTPTPPPHQQTGLPKIAASPTFVDKSTLLPKRGPQGAATAPTIGDDGNADPVPRP